MKKSIFVASILLLLFLLSSCSSSTSIDGQYSADGKPRYDVSIDSSTKLVTIRVPQADGIDSMRDLGYTEDNGKLIIDNTDVYNNYQSYVTGAYVQQVNANKIHIILKTSLGKNITETYIRLGTNGTEPVNGFSNTLRNLFTGTIVIVVVMGIISFFKRIYFRSAKSPEKTSHPSLTAKEHKNSIYQGAEIIDQGHIKTIENNIKEATTSGIEDVQLENLIGKTLKQVKDEIGPGIVIAKKMLTSGRRHPIPRSIIDYPSFNHHGSQKVVLIFDDETLVQADLKPLSWLPTDDDPDYQMLVDDRNVEHYK